jgi:DNA-directed RNA polymerase specialized sigma subunit
VDPPVVKRASDNLHRSIHLPNNVHDDAGRLYRFQPELEARLARSPTDDELAEATGMNKTCMHEVTQLTRMDLSLDVPRTPAPPDHPRLSCPTKPIHLPTTRP